MSLYQSEAVPLTLNLQGFLHWHNLLMGCRPISARSGAGSTSRYARLDGIFDCFATCDARDGIVANCAVVGSEESRDGRRCPSWCRGNIEWMDHEASLEILSNLGCHYGDWTLAEFHGEVFIRV
jgi:hypothetical protein